MILRRYGLPAIAILGIVGMQASTSAENLHQKYRDRGDDKWNCHRITFGDARIPKCLECERQGKDYDDSAGGFCVARESLRDRIKKGMGLEVAPAPKHPRTVPHEPRTLPRARRERWGAVAAALWRDSSGAAMVASGISWNEPTRSQAYLADCGTRTPLASSTSDASLTP
jgi:hypothetical protein